MRGTADDSRIIMDAGETSPRLIRGLATAALYSDVLRPDAIQALWERGLLDTEDPADDELARIEAMPDDAIKAAMRARFC